MPIDVSRLPDKPETQDRSISSVINLSLLPDQPDKVSKSKRLKLSTRAQRTGAGISKALYERVPFGKRIVGALDPEKAAELEAYAPEGLAAKIGAGAGSLVGLAPSFGLTNVAYRTIAGIPRVAKVASTALSKAPSLVRAALPRATEGAVSLAGAEALQPGASRERISRAGQAVVPGAAFGVTGLAPNLATRMALSGGAGAALAPPGERLPQGIIMGGLPVVSRALEGRAKARVPEKLEIPKGAEIAKEAVKPTESIQSQLPALIKEKAANIRIDKFKTTEGAKEVLRQTAKEFPIEIEAQRRGVIHNDQLKKLSSELGMSSKDLQEVSPGTSANAETLLAARTQLASSAETVKRSADNVAQLKEGTPEFDTALSDFTKLYELHVNNQIAVSGMVAEAGRALAQQRLEVRPGTASEKLLEAIIQDRMTPTGKRAAEIARELSRVTEGNLSEAVSKLTRATFMEKLVEYATAAKLSNVPTFVANTFGNGVMTLLKTPERFFAAGIESGKSILKSIFIKSQRPRERYFGEIVADWGGMMHALRTQTSNSISVLAEAAKRGGPREILRVLSNEKPSFAEATRAREAIPRGGAIRGLKGKIIRTPFRVLTWLDDFQSGIVRQGETAALAYRQAMREGLIGRQRFERTQELIKNPPLDILRSAEKEALKRTFRQPLGEFGNRLLATRNVYPGVKLVLPFVRTIVNIGKAETERFMLGGLVKSIRLRGVEQSEALALAATGLVVNMALYLRAASGDIQGSWKGLSDSDKDDLRAAGMQPFSFRIGDKWVSYRNLEPVTFPVFLMSELADSVRKGRTGEEEVSKGILRVSTAIGRGLVEQSFLLGISDIIGAIDDPERKGERVLQNLATGTFIPSVVSAAARTIDPTLRKPSGVVEAVKTRLPVLSKQVRPQRDVFGEPIQRAGIPALETISRVRFTTQKEDPLRRTLKDLDVDVGFPSEKIGTRKLTPKESDDLLRVSGQLIRKRLQSLFSIPEYQRLSIEEKQQQARRVINDTRDAVRNALLVQVELRNLKVPSEGLTSHEITLLRNMVSSKAYKNLDDRARRVVVSNYLSRIKRTSPGVKIP